MEWLFVCFVASLAAFWLVDHYTPQLDGHRHYVYRLTVRWPDKTRTYNSFVKREMVRLKARYTKEGHPCSLRRETWVGETMVRSEVVDG